MSRAHQPGRAAAVVAASIALALPSPALGGAAPCEAVRVDGDRASLPVAWREAIDALVHATRAEGLPWSCPGGSVRIALDPAGGAVLTVTDARGATASRAVPSPAELVATGEALLAAPLVMTKTNPAMEARAASPTTPPLTPPIDAPPLAASRPVAPSPPRLLVQVLLGARGSGPELTGWGTGEIRGILPLEAWSIGFWVRYDLPFAGPPHAPAGFEMDAIGAGFGVGRLLVGGPFELRLSVDPSMSVVMMESGKETTPGHPEGAKIAFRMGGFLSGTFRIASIFRGVIAIDGEFAPAGISGLRKIEPSLPAVPAYTVGLMVGVEAVIR